ncbi:hypothetical protein GSI_07543 [Ganoderma sinense ZZ0214-1]|uniref:FAD-binding domain-containing protein n=1 Tax=Ganoderma sinense ZZ0214-1 TaxID=1077348 RepID=A0A2G8S9U4_9APHY|nr:hypothetical protein GSI_07543 [Ganoderma sinense ZZ0214-1]
MPSSSAKPETWVISSDPAEAILLKHFAGWRKWLLNPHRLLRRVRRYSRPLWTLHIGHSWIYTPEVTIIGDTAHLMNRFSGTGINMALLEGLELSLALGLHETGKLGDAGAIAATITAFEESIDQAEVKMMANGNR